jgi:hypothetical protein
MKTKVMYIAAFMVIAASVAAVANGKPGNAGMAVVPVKGSEVFKVIYRGESTSRVRLNVYNSSSDIVFTETFNNLNGFIRPLNFSGLKFGEYTIEVTDAQGTRVEKISHQPVTSERTVHVSKLVNDEGSFLLSVARNSGEAITVKIFDKASNLLYTGSKSESGDFAQVYTLKDVTGAVTFEVSDKSGLVKTIEF